VYVLSVHILAMTNQSNGGENGTGLTQTTSDKSLLTEAKIDDHGIAIVVNEH
jgi:hypothetical protein